MTTNRPEVVGFATHHDEPMLFPSKREAAMYCDDGEEPVALISLSDYEALQAECEKLRTALAESRANDQQAMRYLNQVREIVGGDDFPDMVRRCERLQAKCARLQAAMIEAKGHISHYMYGGSAYREPAAKAIALIDDALQEANP